MIRVSQPAVRLAFFMGKIKVTQQQQLKLGRHKDV